MPPAQLPVSFYLLIGHIFNFLLILSDPCLCRLDLLVLEIFLSLLLIIGLFDVILSTLVLILTHFALLVDQIINILSFFSHPGLCKFLALVGIVLDVPLENFLAHLCFHLTFVMLPHELLLLLHHNIVDFMVNHIMLIHVLLLFLNLEALHFHYITLGPLVLFVCCLHAIVHNLLLKGSVIHELLFFGVLFVLQLSLLFSQSHCALLLRTLDLSLLLLLKLLFGFSLLGPLNLFFVHPFVSLGLL